MFAFAFAFEFAFAFGFGFGFVLSLIGNKYVPDVVDNAGAKTIGGAILWSSD